MNLCIDEGNTRVKLAVFHQNKLLHFEAVPKLSPTILQTMQKQFPLLTNVILSSVRLPQVEIMTFLNTQFQFFIELSHNTYLPISNNYHTPKTLGKDRIAGVVAGNHMYPNTDLLVIDAGTCITYDCITAKGCYEGGSISPGIAMRFKSLPHFTAKLPLVDVSSVQQAIPPLIGKSTLGAIQSGIANGVAAEFWGIVHQYRQLYPKIKVIITGGDLHFFESRFKNEIFAHQNLILEGLNAILHFNLSKYE